MVSREVADPFARIATLFRIDRASVQWGTGEHAGAVLVHTPWARVMIGRSPAQALTTADAWARGRSLWLHEAVCRVYPGAAGEANGTHRWQSAARIREAAALLGQGAVDFVEWALADPGPHWRSLPDTEVRGAWRAWHDAVLLHQRSAGDAWQLRLSTDADFGLPFPYRRPSTAGDAPAGSRRGPASSS